ncbi:MAG: Ig-like domain-containing protein, partial [Candidatus Korarchaeota archaeon]
NVRGTITITWSASDGGSGISGNAVNIYYGTSSNGPWYLIVANTPNDGSHDWNTASVSDGLYYIMINCSDNVGNTNYDVSNNAFRIDNTPPSVAVNYPTTGATLSGIVTISWSASDDGSGVNTIDLFYRNSSIEWTPIATGIPNSGSYNWDTTAVDDGEYWIRIVARDNAGNEAENTSGNFTISNIVYLMVTSPTGGTVSGVIDICWDYRGISGNVSIQIKDSENGEWREIANVNVIAKNYSWNTSSESDGNTYSVRIVYNATIISNVISGIAINNFAPVVSANVPSLLSGMVTISWNAVDGNGIEHVSIYYGASQSGPWIAIAENISNNGSIAWNSRNVGDGRYYIRVIAYDGLRSGEYITQSVVIDNTAPEVNLATSISGNIVTISWNASDGTGSGIKLIEIYYASSLDGPWILITSTTSSNGSYKWDVSGIASGTYYIIVNCTDNVGQYTIVNGSVSISQQAPPIIEQEGLFIIILGIVVAVGAILSAVVLMRKMRQLGVVYVVDAAQIRESVEIAMKYRDLIIRAGFKAYIGDMALVREGDFECGIFLDHVTKHALIACDTEIDIARLENAMKSTGYVVSHGRKNAHTMFSWQTAILFTKFSERQLKKVEFLFAKR